MTKARNLKKITRSTFLPGHMFVLQVVFCCILASG